VKFFKPEDFLYIADDSDTLEQNAKTIADRASQLLRERGQQIMDAETGKTGIFILPIEPDTVEKVLRDFIADYEKWEAEGETQAKSLYKRARAVLKEK
jgi:hypothetical protein